MKTELQLRDGTRLTVEETLIDRAIRYVSPVRGLRRFRSRVMQAVAGSYVGASRSRRSLRSWNPRWGDADSDTIFDLQALRDRSRDLVRNEPLAGGAINTVVTNVVGTGLVLQARVCRDALGMTDEEADAWESTTEREWALFAGSVECDAARTLTFAGLQDLVFRSVLESGDAFVLLPSISRPFSPSPYRLGLQIIEADRVCNEGNRPDTARVVGGIEKDEYGAARRYHIMTTHPGSILSGVTRAWTLIDAYGAQTGRRNVIHLYRLLRPGQTRGVPYLAPVIEPLKQLGRYTEAELMAAVVSGMFTVFVKSEMGDGELGPMMPTEQTGGSQTDEDYKLGYGAIVGLAPGEDITNAKPERPNTAFDPFVTAILRQIGVALELPYEVLVKHFTASYSAARAALLEAWKFFQCRREWLALYFCQAVYAVWMAEAVALGRIHAPGFFSDPLLRAAYLGSEWIGPSRGQIDEYREVQAAELRLKTGISTLDQETAALTGGDWERNHKQQVKEKRARVQDGLELGTVPAGTALVVPEPETREELDDRR